LNSVVLKAKQDAKLLVVKILAYLLMGRVNMDKGYYMSVNFLIYNDTYYTI